MNIDSIDQAEAIAAATATLFTTRADTADPSEWVFSDSYTRYLTLLRSGTSRATGPREVIAEVTGPDVDTWGYVASDILDDASGSFHLPETSRIHVDGGRATLTW